MKDSLEKALAAFIDPIKLRVFRGTSWEWQVLPSLWEQLNGSGQWVGGNGGAGAFGSRPVISTGAVSIIMEVIESINKVSEDYGRIIHKKERVRVKGCWCLPYRACPGYRDIHVGRDHEAELRAVAANVPNADVEVWWTERLRRWASQTRAVIGLNSGHLTSIRGAACPECKAKTVEKEDDERTLKIPALGVTWGTPDGEEGDYHEDHEYLIRAVECRACSRVWWRGPELDAFASVMSRR